MNTRNLARNLLLVVVGTSVAWFLAREWRQARADGHADATPAAEAATVGEQPHVVMTYFTTNVRCTSCRTIETLTRETAETHHASAIADGRLVFQVINTDDPGMRHYVSAYELVSKTVILSRRVNGREVEWENMGDVWTHMHDPELFHAYLGKQLNQWGAM